MEVTLFVDHQCNLRCGYCYTGEKFKRRMSVEVMQRAIERALDTRPPHLDLSFFGGEPLLHLDLLERARAHAEQRVAQLSGPRPRLRYVLNSNLTLLDDDCVSWLLRAQPCVVFASLDGPATIHDSQRRDAAGHPSHARVLAGLARLRELGIAHHLVAVITPEVAPRLGDIVAELFSEGSDRAQLSPDLSADWSDAALAGLEAGLRDAAELWQEEFRRGVSRRLEPLHTKVLTHLHGGVPCASRCTLGGREWAVAPSGRIYPCAQMVREDTADELVIGDVEHGICAARVARMQAQKDLVETTCADCALRDRCQSHCGCRHVALTGRLGQIDARLCDTERAFVDAADRVASVLYAEQCPAFLDFYYRRPWQMAPDAELKPLRLSRDP